MTGSHAPRREGVSMFACDCGRSWVLCLPGERAIVGLPVDGEMAAPSPVYRAVGACEHEFGGTSLGMHHVAVHGLTQFQWLSEDGETLETIGYENHPELFVEADS